MVKQIVKYVGLGLVALALILSVGLNAASFYKGYANSLRAEGYNEAMQVIDATLTQQGKLELTKRKPDGSFEQIILMPVLKNKPAETKK